MVGIKKMNYSLQCQVSVQKCKVFNSCLKKVNLRFEKVIKCYVLV